jgi:hypothetical protein
MPGKAIYCLALMALIFVSSENARAQSDQTVYSDSLGAGWADWSWSGRDLNSTDFVHSGSRSIKVTYSTSGHGFRLRHTAFDSALYTALTFWIHGGATNGRQISVAAQLDDEPLTGVPLNSFIDGGSVVAGAWRKVTVPLGALGADNKGDLTGFWLQDSSGGSQPPFYLDDIAFVGAPAPAQVNLNIDANNIIRSVDERMFGVSAAIWDAQFATPATVSLLADNRTRITRFPGGSLSDEYHWRTNTTGTNTFQWATNFDEFAAVTQSISAQAFITVNYGSGTAQEAAEWVRYSNLTRGYGFKYWEVGNENYGGWERDERARPHDPFTYAMVARDYINAMKTVDPSIKVGVVVVTGEDSFSNYTDHPALNARTNQTHNGWTPVLLSTLRSLGVTPDFVIYHRYEQAPGQEDDAALLQSARTWKDDAADLRRQLDDYLGPQASQVEIVCTENNSVYSNPGKQTTSLVNGLFYADSLGQALKTEFNAFIWWITRNSRETGNNNSDMLYGWRQYGDYGMISDRNEPHPTYYVSKLVNNFAAGGDQMIAAASDYLLLSVYAARRESGALSLLVINKSRTASLSARINIAGFTPQPDAVIYSYGIPQDEAARTGSGSPDIAMSATNTASSSFEQTFPPYSATVIALTTGAVCAPAITPSSRLFASAGGEGRVDVAAGSSCQWTAASNASWITVASGATGTGNGAITIVVERNDSSLSRTGSITAAGQTFIVLQNGTADCSYSISPASKNFKGAGGTGSISVTCDERCAWQATSDVDWITFTVGLGTGNGDVRFTVAPNTTGATRKGRINVGGQVFKVKQKK